MRMEFETEMEVQPYGNQTDWNHPNWPVRGLGEKEVFNKILNCLIFLYGSHFKLLFGSCGPS